MLSEATNFPNVAIGEVWWVRVTAGWFTQLSSAYYTNHMQIMQYNITEHIPHSQWITLVNARAMNFITRPTGRSTTYIYIIIQCKLQYIYIYFAHLRELIYNIYIYIYMYVCIGWTHCLVSSNPLLLVGMIGVQRHYWRQSHYRWCFECYHWLEPSLPWVYTSWSCVDHQSTWWWDSRRHWRAWTQSNWRYRHRSGSRGLASLYM